MFQGNLDVSMGRHERQALEPFRKLLLQDTGIDDQLDGDNYDDTRAEMLSTGHNVTSVLMNPRETVLDNLMDGFATDQSQVLDILNPITPVQTEIQECQKIIKKLQRIMKGRAKASTYTVVTRAPTKEDVETCFREVPLIFFKAVMVNGEIRVDDLNEMLNYGKLHNVPVIKMEPYASTTESSVSPLTIYSPPNIESNLDVISNNNNLNQERLSGYLDLVEVALLKQIWSKSPAFFRATEDINLLQDEVKLASHIISARRRELQNIASCLKFGALRIPYLHNRSENQRKLLNKLNCMQKILSARNTVENLLSIEDHLGALQITKLALNIYYKECMDIVSLKYIGKQLMEYEEVIALAMCEKFVIQSMSWQDMTNSDNTNDYSDFIHDYDGQCNNMVTIIQALLIVKKLETALNLYNSRILDNIKIIIRSCVSEYLIHMDTSIDISNINSNSSNVDHVFNQNMDTNDSPFSLKVKEMSLESFFSCLSLCFEQLLNVLHVCDSMIMFMMKTILTTDDISSSDYNNQYHEKTNVNEHVDKAKLIDICISGLKAACDTTQKYISQFLLLRKESFLLMTTEQMKLVWNYVSNFIISIEKLVTGEKFNKNDVSVSTSYNNNSNVLKKTLIGIIKHYLDSIHDVNKSKIVSCLDSEKWTQCDVSSERQNAINLLSSGKAFLHNINNPASTLNNTFTSANITMLKHVTIDGQVFNTSWSALLLIEMILEYLNYASSFSSKLIEETIIPKITELLQLFDVHSNRLVLGAQATKSAAALKSISARHLAITVQSIGLILVLLPHTRTALLGNLTSFHMHNNSMANSATANTFLIELDRISNQYSEHQSKLLTKFVTIIGEAVDMSSAKLRGTDWDRFNGQCEYFEEIIKNISALHRVLISILPQEQVQNVFTRIFMFLNRKIPLHFDDIIPTTQTGKQRILDEISHLVVSLQQLPQLNATAVTLEETFKKKYDSNSK